MNLRAIRWSLPVAALAATAMILPAAPAEACGGFFCNQQPVDQTGENILFVQQGDQIEAHVNIIYQGDAEDFAWIVPTPSRPEVGISTQDLFARLNQQLSVRYFLEFEGNDDCFFFGADEQADADPSPSPNDGGGVTVVQQSSVGPYDFAVLQATSTEALLGWLQDNNYDIPNDVGPFIEPYVIPGSEMHFVAFRLQNDRQTGDIAPVILKYSATQPMVPIKLTGIATQPDMGVRVHILSEDRAVPQNYLHVHVNEARINWLQFGNNYNALVTEAMNEAGGQGFTTEYAGPSEVMAETLFREGQYDTAALAEIDNPVAFMEALMQQGFRGNPQLLSMFQRYIPMPESLKSEGVEERDFYNCLSCYAEALEGQAFDAVAFANELESTIVAPLRHAQELFDTTPYLSRLYTTLSAEEMTRDPVFAYNANMADVSNVRTATATTDCDPERPESSTITITLQDGRQFTTTWEQSFNPGPEDGDAPQPAASVIEETSGASAPRAVRDINTGVDILDDVLTDRANEPDTARPPVLGPGELESGIGCATAPGAPGSAPLALGLLALGLLAVRRR